MKRTIAIITLIGLPAFLIALAGVRLVMHDRSSICSALANQPECMCGCRAKHGLANAKVSACAERMATEAGVAILLLLIIILGGMAGLFAVDACCTRRKSAAHRAFVAEISHRLRTPLTGLCLNADLLKEDRLPEESDRRDAIAAIAENSARLTDLVEKLLDHVARS